MSLTKAQQSPPDAAASTMVKMPDVSANTAGSIFSAVGRAYLPGCRTRTPAAAIVEPCHVAWSALIEHQDDGELMGTRGVRVRSGWHTTGDCRPAAHARLCRRRQSTTLAASRAPTGTVDDGDLRRAKGDDVSDKC
jgi:hypothetical protein